MSADPSDRESRDEDVLAITAIHRRRVLALGAGLGVTMLAGCSSVTDPNADESPTDEESPSGSPSGDGGNLLPVISKSGVTGKDVEVDENDAGNNGSRSLEHSSFGS